MLSNGRFTWARVEKKAKPYVHWTPKSRETEREVFVSGIIEVWVRNKTQAQGDLALQGKHCLLLLWSIKQTYFYQSQPWGKLLSKMMLSKTVLSKWCSARWCSQDSAQQDDSQQDSVQQHDAQQDSAQQYDAQQDDTHQDGDQQIPPTTNTTLLQTCLLWRKMSLNISTFNRLRFFPYKKKRRWRWGEEENSNPDNRKTRTGCPLLNTHAGNNNVQLCILNDILR